MHILFFFVIFPFLYIFIIVCGKKKKINEFMYFKLTSLRAIAQANCCVVTNVAEDWLGMFKLFFRRWMIRSLAVKVEGSFAAFRGYLQGL